MFAESRDAGKLQGRSRKPREYLSISVGSWSVGSACFWVSRNRTLIICKEPDPPINKQKKFLQNFNFYFLWLRYIKIC
jgi:hypothetical protein